MAIGAGFQDVQLQIELAEVQNRQTRYRQQYEQKQAIDEQERLREQMGAEVVGSVSQGGTKKEQYERIMTIIKNRRYKGIDVTGTSAGKMFLPSLLGRDSPQQYSLDYYKSLDLTPGQAQQALERKHLGAEGTSFPGKMTDEESQIAEFMDAKIKAEEAGDTLKVSLINEKLSQMPRYKQLQDRVHGPTRDAWLSEMEAGGFTEFITDKTPKQTIKGTWGTWDKRYGPKAYAATLQKAMVKGGLLGLPAEQIAGAFNRWWDKEHKKQQSERWQVYGARPKFNPQETAENPGYGPGNVQTVTPATGAELKGGMTDRVATDKYSIEAGKYGNDLKGMYEMILSGADTKKLTEAIVLALLKETGNDPVKARKLAKERGYSE